MSDDSKAASTSGGVGGGAAAAARQPSLSMATVNPRVAKMSHAVRGKLTVMANELKERLEAPDYDGSLPFDELIMANIGNPHNLGQPPVTFFRQVLAHVMTGGASSRADAAVPADVVARGDELIRGLENAPGAYTNSQGAKIVRQHVAAFVAERDGVATSADHVFLTDGASAGVRVLMTLIINQPTDGVLVPCPQYSLYGATLTQLNGAAVPYYLDEERGWAFDVAALDDAYERAAAAGVAVRALVVINPGNPTAAVLDEADVVATLAWAERRNVLIVADEVYQANVYAPNKSFVSFRRVLKQSSDASVRDNVQLVSLHSCSKGVTGECGARGGYMHTTNVDADVRAQIYKVLSVALCCNVTGQVLLSTIVRPPRDGDPSYALYASETGAIFESLAARATLLHETLNSLEGYSCTPLAGAMYAFPRVRLPPRAIAAAKQQGMAPDALYCLELLMATGICVVPGSGFGQREGTHHYRTTILPRDEKVAKVARLLTDFHAKFLDKYGHDDLQ